MSAYLPGGRWQETETAVLPDYSRDVERDKELSGLCVDERGDNTGQGRRERTEKRKGRIGERWRRLGVENYELGVRS